MKQSKGSLYYNEFLILLFASSFIIFFGFIYTAERNLISSNIADQLSDLQPISYSLNSFSPFDFSPFETTLSSKQNLYIQTHVSRKQKPQTYAHLHPIFPLKIRPIKSITLKIRPGDTINAIFKRAHLNSKDCQKLITIPKSKTILRHIKPGQSIKLGVNNTNQIEILSYDISPTKQLLITRDNETFITNVKAIPLKTKLIKATGKIKNSLSAAIQAAHLPHTVLFQLIDIFDNKINFKKRLYKDDQFKIIYNVPVDSHGHAVKAGDIVAAEIINHGEPYYAIQYTDHTKHTGYYTPKGRNLHTAFLRFPVRFKRISSRFNARRMHPILHIIRPHKGVDLAARAGTPIKAAGNGRIIFRGRKGGYGKVIIIHHDRHYTTVYAHMSRFAGRLHIYSYVHEGQVIGYVGQTGFATGPHLHYEFHVNGIARDPLKVRLPNGSSIPKADKNQFLKYAAKQVKQLNNL